MSDQPGVQPVTPVKPTKPLGKRIARIGVAVVVLALVISGVSCFVRQRIHLYGNLLPDLNIANRESQYKKLEENRGAKTVSATAGDDLAKVSQLPSWPAYRGFNRDGMSREMGLIQKWPEAGPREVYRQPVGAGWSGFIIGLGRAYTVEQRRDKEAVTCYDLANGKELWAVTYNAAFSENLGGEGPRSTPALDAGKIFALGAEGDFHAIDALTGQVIWKTNILKDTGSSNLTYGTASSPLVVGDKVYLTSTGKGDHESLLAYDKNDGKIILRVFPEPQAYTSLDIATLAGKRQLLNVASMRINGLDPETGQQLWKFPWSTNNGINCAQPVIAGEDKIFLSSGYGQGCALIQVLPGEGGLMAKQLWANNKMKNKFNSSVIINNHVFGLDEGVMACLDLKTGEQKWKGGRYGHGQLIYADGNLIVMGEKGKLALVKAKIDGHEEISSVQALSSKTWNNIALAGGILLVRNDREMVCYDLNEQMAK